MAVISRHGLLRTIQRKFRNFSLVTELQRLEDSDSIETVIYVVLNLNPVQHLKQLVGVRSVIVGDWRQ